MDEGLVRHSRRDEEEVLPELYRRLDAVAPDIQGECEFIFVDDGSTDRTREVLSELRGRDQRVKLLFLARNFGHQLAITAGLDFASGDAVVIMDGDLQDPPEVALEMIPLWREGYEVVHAIRRHREGESRMKLWTAHHFYRLMHRLSDVDLPVDAGDFRLVDRRVADIVRGMREPDRYLRGMFAWVGFRQTSVAYDRDQRFAGQDEELMGQHDQLRDRRHPGLHGRSAPLHPRARLRDLARSAWFGGSPRSS